ncbi:MAG: hypothetical protein KJ566_00880 [Nanoarchaeota archaeon]|nr:hypothetical protein [Nanoarchaeota archaeon]
MENKFKNEKELLPDEVVFRFKNWLSRLKFKNKGQKTKKTISKIKKKLKEK